VTRVFFDIWLSSLVPCSPSVSFLGLVMADLGTTLDAMPNVSVFVLVLNTAPLCYTKISLASPHNPHTPQTWWRPIDISGTPWPICMVLGAVWWFKGHTSDLLAAGGV